MVRRVTKNNNNNNNNNNGRRQGGVRKEEIQQWGTITLMRTVKNTHNIKLRENVRLGEVGSKYRLVKIGFQKNTCN
jgi:hypothetical protein